MINDHRPLYIKRLVRYIESWYRDHFVAPHFESLGANGTMMKPWNIKVHGAHISAGDNLHVITANDRHVTFSTWQFADHQGHITLGDNCLVCPGVRLDSASSISIGDNCMFAAGAYVTDADWPAMPTETEIYILPDGRVVVADMPMELAEAMMLLGDMQPCEVQGSEVQVSRVEEAG